MPRLPARGSTSSTRWWPVKLRRCRVDSQPSSSRRSGWPDPIPIHPRPSKPMSPIPVARDHPARAPIARPSARLYRVSSPSCGPVSKSKRLRFPSGRERSARSRSRTANSSAVENPGASIQTGGGNRSLEIRATGSSGTSKWTVCPPSRDTESCAARPSPGSRSSRPYGSPRSAGSTARNLPNVSSASQRSSTASGSGGVSASRVPTTSRI